MISVGDRVLLQTSEAKDMLLVDKMGRITSRTCAAVIMWPGMMGEDLARLECAMRGKDSSEYR